MREHYCDNVPAVETVEEQFRIVIEKWEEIVKALQNNSTIEIRNLGKQSCAFCVQYWDSHDCEGCPIKEYTGERYCVGTPYNKFYSDQTLDNAVDELEFLVNLQEKAGYGSDNPETEDAEEEYDTEYTNEEDDDPEVYTLDDAYIQDTAEEALEVSIEKWKIIVSKLEEGYAVDNYSAKSCSLCRSFLGPDCRGCPVRKKTGVKGCKETPYDVISKANYDNDGITPTNANIETAQEEVEFLESLRVKPNKEPASVTFECPKCPSGNSPTITVEDAELANYLGRHDVELKVSIKNSEGKVLQTYDISISGVKYTE